MKKIVTFILALVLVWNLSAENVAKAAYVYFPTSFRYFGSGSASQWVTEQTLDTYGSGNEYAFADCDYFHYTGGMPGVSVLSISQLCPTYSTLVNSEGSFFHMEYYNLIPTNHYPVKFKGTLTMPSDWISATIFISVQG